jgi:hypothetical protein
MQKIKNITINEPLKKQGVEAPMMHAYTDFLEFPHSS